MPTFSSIKVALNNRFCKNFFTTLHTKHKSHTHKIMNILNLNKYADYNAEQIRNSILVTCNL